MDAMLNKSALSPIRSSVRIFTEEDTVRTTDEFIRTTDEFVITTEDAVAPTAITEGAASKALEEEFGALVDDDYIPGKTRFRDALAARFDLSQLDAEDLCETLEQAGSSGS